MTLERIGSRPTVWRLALLLSAACALRLAAQGEILPAGAPADTVKAAAAAETGPGLNIGYNLKITVRLAPVYTESTLVSKIIAYLPQNSVVTVVSEHDNWYRIAFGPEEKRQTGWVISYGAERTHDLERIMTNQEETQSWAGQKVEVAAGESTVRAFPSVNAEMLLKVFRGEVFEIAGEAQDFYMIQVSDAARGWIWKGDVQIYAKPRYTKDQIKEMRQTVSRQDTRLKELDGLLADLSLRRAKSSQDIQSLERLIAEREAAARVAAVQKQRGRYFSYANLKSRTSLHGGFQMQKYGPKLGLASVTLKGIGGSFTYSDRLILDLFWASGSPTVSPLGAQQKALPASLKGLDTLNVTSGFLRLGVSYRVDASRLPLLKIFDNYLYLGLGLMSLKPTAAGITETQRLFGPVYGWRLSRRLFSRLSFEAGLSWFVTQAEVTDVRTSGSSLVSREKRLLFNRSLSGGVLWNF
jgi:hypothetical protein